MPVTAQLHDGRTLEFPDGTDPSVVQATVKKVLGAPAQQEAPKPTDWKQSVRQGAGDLVAGGIRGAGSIGATIMTPLDALAQKFGIQNDFIGRDDRREAMTSTLKDAGADTDSLSFGAGKLGAEVAGTAGAGGLLAKPLAAAFPRLAAALTSGGFTTGSNLAKTSPFAQKAADMGIRMTGGAIAGGASAGLVDPEQAGTGAAIGGLLPPVARVAGAAGTGIRNTIRGPQQSPDAIAAIKSAQQSGYVIPPSQAKPTLANRMLEGFAGKLSTAQNASAKNAEVTNRLAAEALGLPGDIKLTPDVLTSVRKTAGQAYEALGVSGTIKPGAEYTKALDDIIAPHLKASQGFPNAKVSPVVNMIDELRTDAFDASSAMAKISELRSAADDAFRAGNSDIGRASKKAADAIEDSIEKHLSTTKQTDLLDNFRDARKLYAKTYTVEKALNPSTGTVDAKKLGSMLKRGKPLTGELKAAGEFANRFPKAAQPVEGIGSMPQTSPLDWFGAGGLSLASGNMLPMAGVLARPAARHYALSDFLQSRLANQSQPGVGLLGNPELQKLGYRAAPVAGNR
jgi:hypothetical protein